jgi:hypothetical protein
MLPANTHKQRIASKCRKALEKAIDSFDDFLKEADPDAAAAIIAGLIRSQLELQAANEDPGEALAEVIKKCYREEDDEYNL